jgi:hypothetical protein
MGYILSAIAVDLGEVSGTVASGKRQLLSALVEQFEDEFGQFDEMAADCAGDEEGGGALTMRRALAQMVMGEEYDEGPGFMYGYALEFLCRHFGETLPNGEWSAMPSGTRWAEAVDRELGNAGVPESVFRVGTHLLNRGAPIAIPEIDDFPGIGYLTRGEVKAAQAALRVAKLSSIMDKEVLASIKEVQRWLQTCAESGRDLVCFYA